MSLTPLDISKQRFKKVMWGFDTQEVATFLELVSVEMTQAAREVRFAAQECEKLKKSLEEYKEREKAIKDIMLTAQRVTEDMKHGAQKEADLMIARARTAADQLLNESEARLNQLQEDIRHLRRIKIENSSAIKNILEMQLKTLLTFSEDEKVAKIIRSAPLKENG